MTCRCPACGQPVAEPLIVPATAMDRLVARAAELEVAIVDGEVCQRDAAKLMVRAVSSLRRWRDEGRGPPSHRRGTWHYYRVEPIADWLYCGQSEE